MDGKRDLVRKIALERIELLFGDAEIALNDDESLSKRYVKTMRKISSHYKVTIPKRMKDRICTNCDLVLMPGLNCRVRVVSSHRYVAYKCNGCGKEAHVHY
jgi:ribonuclease P protein subunit RPR2